MKKIQKFTPTKSKRKAVKITNALTILDGITAKDRKLREMIAEERVNAQIAQIIYEMRTREGLTQRQLAERIGTKQPVIARLENGDYGGHSLTMLQRIAAALNRTLRISFVQARQTGSSRNLAAAR